MRIRNARQFEAASDADTVFKLEVGVCGHGGHTTGISVGPGVNLAYSIPILRMRNSSQPGAVSDAARVHKHKLFICGRD